MDKRRSSDGTMVPVIPPRKPQEEPSTHPNPVQAICGECGVEWRKVMMYCCQNANCPMRTTTITMKGK